MAAGPGDPLSAGLAASQGGSSAWVDDVWQKIAPLAEQLVAAYGSWAPTLTPDGQRIAFVSDRRGSPELWVCAVGADSDVDGAVPVTLSEDPVLAVHWSPDGQWLACSVATGGGVRTEVWVSRPDGRDARRVAGGSAAGENAVLGPWAREGHSLVVTITGEQPHVANACVLIDPSTGERDEIAVGGLIILLDLTADGRFALLRDGTRGAQFCRMVDRVADQDFPVLPYEHTGSTDLGLFRPAPEGDETPFVAYLVSDAGRPRRELIAIGVHDDGRRVSAGTLAARDDAELEWADCDAAGTTLALAWNVAGRSELELLDAANGRRTPVPGLPGEVVSALAMARDGSCVAVCVEGAASPRSLWRLDTKTLQWQAIVAPAVAEAPLVAPELVRFEGHDGLPLTGWLYRAPHGDGAAMISLHGGPEAQERPVFSPQHQVLAAAGVSVFAPNIRGSSGFGRAFVHADDRYGRVDAIRDVADCARMLVENSWADPRRIAVTGRSYGGYATLMALVRHGPAFAAGVDICGMSDLATFYRDSEPWIAAAAVSKYGDPVADAALLAEVSPLHQADAIEVPLLVVHGELDTNVPLNEARQLVARLRDLGRPVIYLELPGEGHEYRRAESRLTLLGELTRFLVAVL